jgi:fibro-slime domain-containing protein
MKPSSALTLVALCFLFLHLANASHFRYMSVSWINQGNRLVTFNIQQAWRYDYPTWGSASIGVPVFTSYLVYGDGAYDSININPNELDTSTGEDWFLGNCQLNHTFSGTAKTFVVYIDSNARISTLADCNHDASFRVETGVDLNLAYGPALTGIPIFPAYYGIPISYQIPVQAPPGTVMRYILTPALPSASTNTSRLVNAAPVGLSVNQNTGVISWTPNANVNPSPSQCPGYASATAPLFSIQVQAQAYANGVITSTPTSYTSIDFIFKVQTPSANLPPTDPNIIPAPSNSIVYATYGTEVSFSVNSTDPFQAAYQPTGTAIISSSLPSGAVFEPCSQGAASYDSTFSAGGTCTRLFRWTPQLGQSTTDMLFYAKNPQGQTSNTVRVTIVVQTSLYIYLSGILRTFAAGTPNFGVGNGDSPPTQFVSSTIGAGGTPVFQSVNGLTTVDTAAHFNAWWSGTGTVYSITLSNIPGTSIYSFTSNSFYPASQTSPYFTYAINTYITYTGGEVFQYNSIDDLWVFINGKLVINLGGVRTTLPSSATSVSLDSLGLTKNNTYSFDLFYAHRGSGIPATQVQSTGAVQCSVLGSGVVSLGYSPTFTTTSGLNLIGAPGLTGGMLQLSDMSLNDFAFAVWSTTPQRVLNGFTSNFNFKIVKGSNTPTSEGFVFVLQRQSTTAVGGTGSNLGYNTIANSIAIEFDCNYDSALGDPNTYHLSVHSRYSSPNSAQETYSLGNATTSIIMDDGQFHSASVQYVPAASSASVALGWIRVYLDNALVPALSVQVNDTAVQAMFNGAAYVGFTASNGNLNTGTGTQSWVSSIYLQNWNFSVVPPSAAWTSPVAAPPASLVAGSVSSVTIQARDACRNTITLGGDGASFSYYLLYSDGVTRFNPSATQLADNGNGQYVLSYNPTKAGVWTLNILFAGSPINGNPWKVTVAPGTTSATTSYFLPNPLPVASAGVQYSYTIYALDAFGNNRTVGGDSFSVAFSSSTFISSVTDNNNGKYTVTYTGTLPGAFTVSTSLQSGNIVGSPAGVTAIAGPANVANCVPGGSGYYSGNVDNAQTTFQVTPVDSYGNVITSSGSDTFSAVLTAPTGATVSCNPMTWDGSKYWLCNFHATVSGQYSVTLTANGKSKNFGAGPNMSPGAAVASTSSVYLVGGVAVSNNQASMTSGTPVTVLVQSRDQYGNNRVTSASGSFSITLTPANAVLGLSAPYTLTDDLNGLYQITYTPKTALTSASASAPHSFTISYNNQPINNSQSISGMVLPGAISSTQSSVSPASNTATAGVAVTCTFTAMDANGNKRWQTTTDASSLTFTYGANGNPGLVTLPVVSIGNAQYTVSVTQYHAVTSQLTTYVNGAALVGLTAISVFPATPSYAPATQLLSGASAGGVINTLSWFLIQANDQYGNPQTVATSEAFTCVTPTGTTNGVELASDVGIYNMTYTNPSTAGAFNILVYLSGTLALNLSATALSQPSAGTSYAYASGISSTQAGTTGSFIIVDATSANANRSGVSVFAVTIYLNDDSSNGNIYAGYQTVSLGNNQYQYLVSYVGKTAGTYTVRIYWNLNIQSTNPANPATLTITPGQVSGPLSTITGLPAVVTAGATNSFSVQVRDIYNNLYQTSSIASSLTASFSSSTGTTVSGFTYNSGSLNFGATYSANFAGTNGLTVQYQSTILGASGAALTVTVNPGTLSLSSSSVSITAPPSAGTQGTVFITPKDSHGNGLTDTTLTWFVTVPADGTTSTNTTYTINPSTGVVTYAIAFRVQSVSAGSVNINIYYGTPSSGQSVGTNPYAISIGAGILYGPLCSINSYSTTQTAGVSFSLSLTAKDVFNNAAHGVVVVFGFSATKVSDSVVATESSYGVYSASYTPSYVGTYTIQVSVANANGSYIVTGIPGLVTFTVGAGATYAPNCRIGTVNSFVAGQTTYFPITMNDISYNLVQVTTNVVAIKFISGRAQCGLIPNVSNPEQLIPAPTPVYSNAITSSFQSSSSGVYNVSMTGTLATADVYSMNVTINGVPIFSDCTKFPTFNIIPGVAAAAQSAIIPGTTTSTAGTVASFTVQVRDAYGNNRQVGGDTVVLGTGPQPSVPASQWVSAANGFIVNAASDLASGQYTLSYYGTTAGTWSLIVTVNGNALTQIGVAIVQPASIASFSDFTVPAITAATPATFYLTGLDQYGNQVSSVNYNYSNTFTRTEADGLDLYGFNATITPLTNGTHMVQLTSAWHGAATQSISINVGASVNTSRSKNIQVLHATCLYSTGKSYRCPFDTSCTNTQRLCSPGSLNNFCSGNNILCSSGSCSSSFSSCACGAGKSYCASVDACLAPADCPGSPATCPTWASYRCPGSNACRASAADCSAPLVCNLGYSLCPDGRTCTLSNTTCTQNAASCSAYPNGAAVRCADGTCVQSVESCPTRPTCAANQILCADGSCQTSVDNCPSIYACYSPTPYRCADGSCRASSTDCPTHRACPLGWVKCANTQCAPTFANCTQAQVCSLNSTRCPDGSCAPNPMLCPTMPSCPPSAPVRCADDSCVVTYDLCPTPSSCDSSLFQCPDGSCVANSTSCRTPPTCPTRDASNVYPVLCAEGGCVSSSSSCSAVASAPCPSFLSVKCSDGSCRKRASDCPGSITCPATKPVRCADGRCNVASDNTCISPSLLQCPNGYIRCPGGMCATSRWLCPTLHSCPANTTYCYDGSCRTAISPCPQEGNFLYKPECNADQVTCPRLAGSPYCASSLAQCPTSLICPPETPVRCHDSTCSTTEANCPPVPKDWVSYSFICPDGSWSDSPTFCGTPSTCPSFAPYKCWDDTCRRVPSDCPAATRCPASAPHLCPNGQCVAYMDTCTPGTSCLPPTSVKCPNSQCVSDVSQCTDITTLLSVPVSQQCANNYYRCRNGNCVSQSSLCQTASCPPYLPYLCSNGLCVANSNQCPDPTVGCPYTAPTMCWDGSCATSTSACPTRPNTTCSLVLCWNNNCVANAAQCPPKNSCPNNYNRCWDKSCADARLYYNPCTVGVGTDSTNPTANACPANRPFRCSDGYCAISSAHCVRYPIALPGPCPSSTPVLCADGSCAAAAIQCPVLPPCSTSETRCGDGSCRGAIPGEACPLTAAGSCPSGWVRCTAVLPSGFQGTGRCARTSAECPVDTTGCPSGTTKCANGTCTTGTCGSILTANGCQFSSSGSYKCPNGGCAADALHCDRSNGCSATAPFRCANGTCLASAGCTNTQCAGVTCANGDCVSSQSQCKTASNCPMSAPVRCADGTCRKYPAFTYSDSTFSQNNTWALLQTAQACTALPVCPFYAPYLCQDWTCVASASFCAAVTACPSSAPVLCSDLSCAANFSACAIDSNNICPPSLPYRCSSGACVKASSFCPSVSQTSCTAPQVQCFDGSCAPNYQQCIRLSYLAHSTNAWSADINHANSTCSDPTNEVLCPDGSCVMDARSCNVISPCPNSAPLRCSDGSCSASSCPTVNACIDPATVRCADGSCRPSSQCPAVFGCPLSTALYCASTAQCVASTTVTASCAVTTSNAQVFSKTVGMVKAASSSLACTTNCNRQLLANSFTITVNPYVSADTQTVAFAVDSTGTTVGQLQILAGSLMPSSGFIASVSVAPVPSSTIFSSSVSVDMYRLDQYPSSLSSAQAVLSTPFLCSLGSTTTSPLPVPIGVVATLDLAYGAVGPTANTNNFSDICLGYLDTASSQWHCAVGDAASNRNAAPVWSSSYNIESNQALGYITTCSNTIYAFILNPLPGTAPIPPSDNQSFLQQNKGAIIGGVIGAACFVAIAIYVGWRLYRYRGKYHEQREKRKELEETVEEMQIVGSQATAEEDDITMTPNPLVLRLQELSKELDTKDKAIQFNKARSPSTTPEADPHVSELQKERDALAAELAKLKAQLEFEKMSQQTGGAPPMSSSASFGSTNYGSPVPPPVFQPPQPAAPLRFGGYSNLEGQQSPPSVSPPSGSPRSFAPPPLPSQPANVGGGFSSQYAGPAPASTSTNFGAVQTSGMFNQPMQQRKKNF